jgi:hypothetical protein
VLIVGTGEGVRVARDVVVGGAPVDRDVHEAAEIAIRARTTMQALDRGIGWLLSARRLYS